MATGHWGHQPHIITCLSPSPRRSHCQNEQNQLPARLPEGTPNCHQGSHEETRMRRQQLTSSIALQCGGGWVAHSKRGAASAALQARQRAASARADSAREESPRRASGGIKRAPCALSKQVIHCSRCALACLQPRASPVSRLIVLGYRFPVFPYHDHTSTGNYQSMKTGHPQDITSRLYTHARCVMRNLIF